MESTDEYISQKTVVVITYPCQINDVSKSSPCPDSKERNQFDIDLMRKYQINV